MGGGTGGMYGLVCLCCILACPSQDDLLATRMVFFELGNVVGLAVDDDPAVAIIIVLCHFLTIKLLPLRLLLWLVIHLANDG